MGDLTKRARLALHDMTGRVDASKLVMFERTIEHAEQLELHIVGLEEAIAQSRDRIEQLEAERDAAYTRGLEDAAKRLDMRAEVNGESFAWIYREEAAAIRAQIQED